MVSDFRLFCIVLFVSLGLGAAAQNHGLWTDTRDLDPGAANIMIALALSSLAVIWFGKKEPKS